MISISFTRFAFGGQPLLEHDADTAGTTGSGDTNSNPEHCTLPVFKAVQNATGLNPPLFEND